MHVDTEYSTGLKDEDGAMSAAAYCATSFSGVLAAISMCVPDVAGLVFRMFVVVLSTSRAMMSQGDRTATTADALEGRMLRY
jgi:hypothetical protein